jgi:hypothetical protein
VKVGLRARRAVASAHLRAPGDPLVFAVDGKVTYVDLPRYAFATSRQGAVLALSGRNFIVVSSGFNAARDQAWLWDSEMPTLGVLELRWVEEDGVAELRFEDADPARLAVFLDRIRKGHRDRLGLMNERERVERQTWGEMGTRREQGRRDTAHYLIRWMSEHPTGAFIPTYWLGPDELGPNYSAKDRGRSFGGLRNAWKTTSLEQAQAYLAERFGSSERAKSQGAEVLTVAESHLERDQLGD